MMVWSYKFFILMFFISKKAQESDCIEVTNMTAPRIQDPRKDMKLHCRFNMGNDTLYVLSWYKDDNEFYNYQPQRYFDGRKYPDQIKTYQFPGVFVNESHTKCTINSCDLLLTNLLKPQSSGAYRCEVSSDAPKFKLASRTENVTVAVLPEKPPIIEHLKRTYYIGRSLNVTCTSEFADPKPQLHFFINGELVNSNDISPKVAKEEREKGIKLRQSKINMKINIDQKAKQFWKINGPNEIICKLTIPGVPGVDHRAGLFSLSSNRTFMITSNSQEANNQQFRWDENSAIDFNNRISKFTLALIIIICFIIINFLQ